jgi:hypothetical protein
MTTYKLKTIGGRYAIQRTVSKIGRITEVKLMRIVNHGLTFGNKANALMVLYWLRKGA